MTNSDNRRNARGGAPHTEDADWAALSARIRALAFARAGALGAAAGDDDEAFDRSARALRLLMGAAEIATRIRRQEEKETPSDEGDEKTPAVTDARIREIRADLEARIARIEADDQDAPARSDAP